MAKYHAGWPIVDESQAKVDWGVAGIPESYLVDPNGTVLSRIVGGVNADALEALLIRAKAVEGAAQSPAPAPGAAPAPTP
jgi:cytochrome c biogenesis protein CcmG/thiol:disulfide interchange protein DsbE